MTSQKFKTNDVVEVCNPAFVERDILNWAAARYKIYWAIPSEIRCTVIASARITTVRLGMRGKVIGTCAGPTTKIEIAIVEFTPYEDYALIHFDGIKIAEAQPEVLVNQKIKEIEHAKMMHFFFGKK